jgi:hypothetical protein
MTVYVENSKSGQKVTHFRPFGETLSLLYVVLGIEDHVKYTPDFKAGELALNYGIFVYELDGNNQVIRGLTNE